MEKNTITSKQSIRSKYLGYRNSLTVNERRTKSGLICDKIKKEQAFIEAEAVLVYMDYRSEVMTTELVTELLAAGNKKVYAPKVEGMDVKFYEIKDLSDLQEGYQGIREPEGVLETLLTVDKTEELKCFALIPGAVFDRERDRMGYGKGFYDRFLAKYTSVTAAALAFECQIAKKVPSEAHDRKVDMIITENEVIK